MRGIWLAAALAGFALVAAGAVLVLWGDGMRGALPTPKGMVPIAVLGDSNSHSYQDGISFPAGSPERGGAMRSQTLQWTEVLARLRGETLDLGPWVTWGRPGTVAWARELIGLPGGRAPKKQDYLYNFSNSGAGCSSLMGPGRSGRFRQAPRLVALMDREPLAWRNGIVVLRIGHNDWAGLLQLQASDPSAPALTAVAAYCAQQTTAAIELIQAKHPGTRVMVVGVINEADDPGQFGEFRTAEATANLKAALAIFNGALRQVVASDPQRRAFFDDAEWLARVWGGRDPQGAPAYRTVEIGRDLRVTNTAGDAPTNALLADHHAGLVWNALWAQALVARLKDAFDLPVAPIRDEEVARFVAATIKAPGS